MLMILALTINTFTKYTQAIIYDKKYIPGKTDKELYEKTYGWSGIPLINTDGIDGEEGLRLGGSLNSSIYPELVKYTKTMEKSIIFCIICY